MTGTDQPRARTVIGLAVASALAAASSQAGPATSSTSPVAPPSAALEPTATSTVAIVLSPTASKPLPAATEAATEPPAPIPILEDEAFRAASARTCTATRPADVNARTAPTWPMTKIPGHQWVHIVVLEMIDRSGSAGAPPQLPSGESYYPSQSGEHIDSDPLAEEAMFGADVDLLACVVLRPGRSSRYSGPQGSFTVTGLDAVAWLADPSSGAPTGEPWVAVADLSTLIDPDNLLSVGGATMLAGDVRRGLAYAMGLALPQGGVAYQGGAGGWAPTEDGANEDLPPGTRLAPGYTFVVRLVVLEASSPAIDFVEILCAPGGTVSGSPLRVATKVPHVLGTFSASSPDVRIDGDFRSDTLATGTISGVSQRARECGIPGSARWEAATATSARADGHGGYTLRLFGSR